MAATDVFAGVPVSDYASARAWYERFFGRAPDMLPHDSEAVWRVADHGWVYVVGDPDRAGKGLLTILVDDLDERVASLEARGIEVAPIETMPGKARTAVVTDPDGNAIQLGQPVAGSSSQSA